MAVLYAIDCRYSILLSSLSGLLLEMWFAVRFITLEVGFTFKISTSAKRSAFTSYNANP